MCVNLKHPGEQSLVELRKAFCQGGVKGTDLLFYDSAMSWNNKRRMGC